MGFSLSWLAVRGKDRDTVLAELKLKATGEREEFAESAFTARMLDGDWFLVVANDPRFIQRAPLSRLSQGAQVVTCMVEEHVMMSSASGLKDGAVLWSIEHDSQHGIDHLKVTGEPPSGFAVIRERLMRKQAQSDSPEGHKNWYQGIATDYIFDIPVQMARHLTDFLHHDDSEIAPGSRPFETLKQVGWWGR